MSNEIPWPPELPLLHIIAQERFRDPAFIIGNRAALEKLRDALTLLLMAPGRAVRAEMYSEDGDDYGTHVFCLPDSNVEHIPYGYTALTDRDDAQWPDWMLTAR